MTVYYDLQCSACAEVSARLGVLRSDYADQMRIVFRHFVDLDDADAMRAAQVGQCLSEQGDYWAFQERMFSTDPVGADHPMKVALELAGNHKALHDCVDSLRGEKNVRFDTREAKDFGLDAEVIVLINGIKTAGARSLSFYRAIIDEELRWLAQGKEISANVPNGSAGAGKLLRESY